MPVNNVNTEALRLVTNAAKCELKAMKDSLAGFENDCDWGVGDETFTEEFRERCQLLDTSIFMCEKTIESFDNE